MRRLAAVPDVGRVLMLLSMPVFAHGLLGRVESPLPLAVCMVGGGVWPECRSCGGREMTDD